MIYVGDAIDGTGYEVFKTDKTPTVASHGRKYRHCVGPFRTMRGARFFASYGRNNPHVQHVNDAERIARQVEEETRRAKANRQLVQDKQEDAKIALSEPC